MSYACGWHKISYKRKKRCANSKDATALSWSYLSVRPRLGLFKTNIFFAGASVWKSQPQNIKSCISLPCFKRNLHKYMSENNFSSNLDGFVWIACLPKTLIVVYMYAHERNVILIFLHICRNWKCINQLFTRAYNICLWYCVYLCL